MPPWWWFPLMAVFVGVAVYCLATMPWDEIEDEWREITGSERDS